MYETRDDARAYGELGSELGADEDRCAGRRGVMGGGCALLVSAEWKKTVWTGLRAGNRSLERAISVRLNVAILRPRF